jgi:hypothetical protein
VCGLDTDHCLLDGKYRGRLAVNKRASKMFDLERFNFIKLYEVKGKAGPISNRFAALENLDNDDADINTSWETVKDIIKVSVKESLGYYELKQHKLWFDKGCSELQIKGNKTKANA